MSLDWKIQSRLKLVTLVAEGNVIRRDVETYLATISGAKVSEWRKLIDARKARFLLDTEDVNAIGTILRAADASRVIGPLAFVMPQSQTPELMRLLGFLAAAKRQMRIFRTLAPAQKWIMTIDPSGEPPKTPL